MPMRPLPQSLRVRGTGTWSRLGITQYSTSMGMSQYHVYMCTWMWTCVYKYTCMCMKVWNGVCPLLWPASAAHSLLSEELLEHIFVHADVLKHGLFPCSENIVAPQTIYHPWTKSKVCCLVGVLHNWWCPVSFSSLKNIAGPQNPWRG